MKQVSVWIKLSVQALFCVLRAKVSGVEALRLSFIFEKLSE